MSFVLHERLAADTFPIMELQLSQLLLMNNKTYPWLILVPRQENKREITDLTPSDRQRLMDEIAEVSTKLQNFTGAFKMNIAALGNMVPQLHVHVIARFQSDPAWPNPVWGSGGETYAETESADYIRRLQNHFHTNNR